MKKYCLLILAVLILLSIPLPVMAADEAKYNFASAQGDKELRIQPGNEGTGYIYFYNIDGNRITHISLEVGALPEGWNVVIEPASGETQVLVSGNPVTVTENLYIEPSQIFEEEPQTIPEGLVSIKIPGRGYTLGKAASIKISVPKAIALGTTGKISIAAEAAWLGQSGSAAVKQARDFEFNVTVVSGQTEFSEQILKPGDTAPGNPASDSSGEDKTSNGWLLPVIIGVATILAVIVLMLLIRRKGK